MCTSAALSPRSVAIQHITTAKYVALVQLTNSRLSHVVIIDCRELKITSFEWTQQA